MSSGSTKELTKALNSSIPTVTLPLPDDLVDIIQGYLEKHSANDDSDAQRLQDELLTIYQNHVLDKPTRLAPFLNILRTLRPAIRGSRRLLQWWDKLSIPVLNRLGEEKGLAIEAKHTLLGILVYDDEEEDPDAKYTTSTVADNLLDVWLKKNFLAMKDFDDEAKFVEGQVQMILLAFGRRRPKDFLTTINKFFVKKDSRILALSLLCEFIRHQPPHLHLMLETPLFENILKCLQIDTSTRVISLAMTALIMFLPHIPIAMAAHIPALFNIYSRMLFWDRERRATESLLSNEENEKLEKAPSSPEDQKRWSKMSYLLESDDETVPELLHYFTFLYGLYPMNFMSYIRKPQRYLRHANFPGADDLDVEPMEIRQRSEPFRQVHLIHPNFFMMTIESELTDNNRWMKSEAADVVAECMALYVGGPTPSLYTSRSHGRDSIQKIEPNSDIPDDPLAEHDSITPYQSRHTSWRNTQSTAVASPDGCRTTEIPRKSSQRSQSLPSIADSPSLRASDRHDSPTIPPQLISPTNNPLQDVLNSKRSTRGSLHQSLTNDSVQSLADSHHDSTFHVDAYLQSLTRDPAPRSPSIRPKHADPSLKVAYLHREIQLLRNDLNFERYLKQQHLSHIGQLRRKQIREARVEAETQNLINSNRGLKSKLEDAKKSLLQMKKETEKSKAHARKWEMDLSTKMRSLKVEQKKWIKEREDLKKELSILQDETVQLRNLVVAAEARELASSQKMQMIEGNLDELERLRAEVDRLTLSLRTFEAGESEATKARDNEEAALKEVAILKMQLRARDEELDKAKSAFENELRDARKEQFEALNRKTKPGFSQEALDNALAASRNRIVEIQKAHNHLLKRYNELQEEFMELKEQHDLAGDLSDSPPLLSSAGRPRLKQSESFRPQSPTPMAPESRRRNHTMSDADFDNPHYKPTSPEIPARSVHRSHSTSPGETRSPVGGMGTAAQGAATYHFGTSAAVPGVGRGSIDEMSLGSLDKEGNSKAKVKPGSDVRVYGRGGVQNIGKKDKDAKKDKGKGKDDAGASASAEGSKKEKKSIGMRGIRGFV